MELQRPRPGFSLAALIAEAKRRARQRRFLILLLLVAAAAVAAAVTFGSSGGGGSRSGGGAGKVGSPSNGSRSVQVGSLWVSVPRRFQVLTGSPKDQLLDIRSVIPHAKNKTHAELITAMANGVELDIQYFFPASARRWKTVQLPLDRQELHVLDGRAGRTWNGLVSGGGSVYSVNLYMGKKAAAADRAAILRALESIRRTR